MAQLAKTLPEYEIFLFIIGELGDIRHFKLSNQINTFIGIDLRHYQSGNYLAQEHITKRRKPYARKILFKAIHNIVSTRIPLRILWKKKKAITQNFHKVLYDCLYAQTYSMSVLSHYAQ
jgi:transposase